MDITPDATGTATSSEAEDLVPIHDRLSVTSHHETGASHAMHTGSSSFQLSLRSFLAQRRKVLNVSPHFSSASIFLGLATCQT
jgi:hypothetical protein